MRMAHQVAKTMRVTKKVMYVGTGMWWPRNVMVYMDQIENRLRYVERVENEQHTETTDSTQ